MKAFSSAAGSWSRGRTGSGLLARSQPEVANKTNNKGNKTLGKLNEFIKSRVVTILT